MSKFQKEYFNQIIKLIKNIQKNQKNKISQAAKLIKKTHEKGGLLYLFGTGHSHMLTIEAFFRAGGVNERNSRCEVNERFNIGVHIKYRSVIVGGEQGIIQISPGMHTRRQSSFFMACHSYYQPHCNQ